MIRKRLATVRKRKVESNEYGTEIVRFNYLGKINGYLDFISIDKGEVAQKIVEDSTHIFICETKLDICQGDRMHIDNKEYEVNFVDRPLMGRKAEIELKLVLQQDDMMDTFIYYGFSTQDNLIETDVLNFNSEKSKTKTLSKELAVEDGKLYIVYPKTFGKASVRVNHKPVADLIVKELMLNGVMHYVYTIDVSGDKIYIELF